MLLLLTRTGGVSIGGPRVQVHTYTPYVVGLLATEVERLAGVVWNSEVEHLNHCIRRETRLLQGRDATIAVPLKGTGATVELWPSQQWETGCMLAARLATDARYTPLPGTPADLHFLPFPVMSTYGMFLRQHRAAPAAGNHHFTNVTMTDGVRAAVAELAAAEIASLVGGANWRRRNGTDHIIYTRGGNLLTELICPTRAGRALGLQNMVAITECFTATRNGARHVAQVFSSLYRYRHRPDDPRPAGLRSDRNDSVLAALVAGHRKLKSPASAAVRAVVQQQCNRHAACRHLELGGK